MATSMDKSILRNINGSYQNRNPSQALLTKDYSLQPRTLLNFVTDDFMRVFLNTCAEDFGKLSEKHIY